MGWVPIDFTAFQVVLYEQICKCLFFIYLLMHLSTHSLLQQIRAQHQLCGRGHTRCWRQQMEEGTVPVPSMIQADSESQLCKHIIVVHSRHREETGARCKGAQQRGQTYSAWGRWRPLREEIRASRTLVGWWELARQWWKKGTPSSRERRPWGISLEQFNEHL